MTNTSPSHPSQVPQLFVAALIAAASLACACGPSAPLCSTQCLAVAGMWSFNTQSASTTGSCAWENSSGNLTVTQPGAGSSVSFSLPVSLVVGVTSLPGNVSGSGSLYENGTLSVFVPQATQNIGTTTIQKTESFQLTFTVSGGDPDAGVNGSGSFTGSWTTNETQTTTGGNSSTPQNCNRTAVVNGSLAG